MSETLTPVLERALPSAGLEAAPAPIVVVSGLPRSGTSMMMRMLEVGGVPVVTDGLRTADEDNPNGYYEVERIKQVKRDDAWLDEAPGKAIKAIHMLLYDLPPRHRYRVVFMRRRLEEVVASQAVMLQRRGTNGGTLDDDRLMEIFRAQLLRLDGWLRSHPNFETLYVDYNEMLRDPAGPVGAVNRFLGGGLDTGAMTAVVDASLYRQRGSGD